MTRKALSRFALQKLVVVAYEAALSDVNRAMKDNAMGWREKQFHLCNCVNGDKRR